MNCPFCDIDEHRTKIIQTYKQTYVAFSNPRLTPGHLLVILKRHVEKLSEFTSDELDELWRTVIDFQERIIARLASGCDLRQNYHPFQKQSRLKVDHLHIHLIPREYKDEIYQITQMNEKNLFKNLNEPEVQKVLGALKTIRSKNGDLWKKTRDKQTM
jgi:diadenosine tetraphosphate (Ap4A) HIT family hydrolase